MRLLVIFIIFVFAGCTREVPEHIQSVFEFKGNEYKVSIEKYYDVSIKFDVSMLGSRTPIEAFLTHQYSGVPV